MGKSCLWALEFDATKSVQQSYSRKCLSNHITSWNDPNTATVTVTAAATTIFAINTTNIGTNIRINSTNAIDTNTETTTATEAEKCRK